MEEAKKRDHRTLGKKLDLFSIQEVGSTVFPFSVTYSDTDDFLVFRSRRTLVEA